MLTAFGDWEGRMLTNYLNTLTHTRDGHACIFTHHRVIRKGLSGEVIISHAGLPCWVNFLYPLLWRGVSCAAMLSTYETVLMIVCNTL